MREDVEYHRGTSARVARSLDARARGDETSSVDLDASDRGTLSSDPVAATSRARQDDAARDAAWRLRAIARASMGDARARGASECVERALSKSRGGIPRRAGGDAARDARARFDDEGDARTRRGRELELAFESATTGAAEAWERGRDAGDDEDARERDARDAEDEYERIAARMEARMAMAFEALEARARRARERETGSSSSDGERARANASEATRRLEELEDRLRSATTTLRATHEELERERKRCAELDAALARARDSTTAAFGEKIQTTRELAEAVAALEGEKADAMHERARLLERMDALERDGVVDGAVMNENLRIELANERAKRGALEEALTDLKLASDASIRRM